MAYRAHTFKEGYAEQSALVAAGTRGPWLRDRLVVSLELSRGCYWDRCDFCNFNDAYDARFKMHDPARVLAEMAHLARTYGQRRFQFLDTALPPRLTRALADPGNGTTTASSARYGPTSAGTGCGSWPGWAG
ncbi:hypothetical protein ACFQ3Z_03755 [Streptomyces nogalater]